MYIVRILILALMINIYRTLPDGIHFLGAAVLWTYIYFNFEPKNG